MTAVGRDASPGVIPVPSLQEFFRQSVGAAMASNRVAVEEHTAHYVVTLLTLFARSEALYDSAEPGPGHRPLALMLADAADAPTAEVRSQALRRLGDVALFVAGCMAEGLDQKAVGVDYYVRMGGSAYRTLAHTLPDTARGRAFAPVFAELASKFADVVDVLNEVSQASRACRDRDVLRLYERWLTTGSRRAGRLLRELGIEPIEQPGSMRSH